MNSHNKAPITIAVVAYFGGEILEKTIESLRSTIPWYITPTIFVLPNGVSIDEKTREYLKTNDAILISNKVEKGLTYRIKQAIAQCETELLILTQDGIGFTSGTIREIRKTFQENRDVTIASAKIEPHHRQTLGESVTEVRALLKWRIGNNWRRKDNYLMINTKCIAFRLNFIQTIQIPDSINNIGAFLYLANKYNKGRFKYVFNAICTNKRPQSIYSYIDWRKSLESTQDEMYKHLEMRPREFSIPKIIVTQSLFLEMVNRPVPTALYFGVLSYIKAKQYTLVIQGKVQTFAALSKIPFANLQKRIVKFVSLPPKRSRRPVRARVKGI